jgi:hypothetical protein
MTLGALERSGLLFVDEAAAVGEDPRQFRVLASRGVLIRVRRGAYCLRSAWEALDEREKHIMRVRAAVHDLRTDGILVAGRSAAALWGMPTLGDWPPDVMLLAPYRNGGKSEPGVRRSAAGFGGATSSTVGGIAVTSLVRTAFDLGRTEGFVAGVMAVDWLRREHGLTKPELWDQLGRSELRAGRRALERIIEFSDPLAETPGESAARAVIHQLGFESPELQVEFRDSEGEMRADFFWRRARVAGEFDGKIKYTRSEYTAGDPSEVVWREKKREDRLRRQVDRIARILWQHVMRPQSLASILLDAGVPRGR